MELTYAVKHEIGREMANAALKERRAHASAREADLASETYDRLYPRQVQDSIKAVPEGFLNSSLAVAVKVGDNLYPLYFADKRPVDAGRAVLELEAGDPLAVRVSEHTREVDAFLPETIRLASGVADILADAKTLGEAIDNYPLIVPYVVSAPSIRTRGAGREIDPTTERLIDLFGSDAHAVLGVYPRGWSQHKKDA